MNRRRFVTAATGGSIISIAGCLGLGESGRAEETLDEFERAVDNRNVDRANELISDEADFEEIPADVFPDDNTKFTLHNREVIESGDDTYVFELDERIDSDESTLEIRVEYDVVFEGGGWHIREAGVIGSHAKLVERSEELEEEMNEMLEEELEEGQEELEEELEEIQEIENKQEEFESETDEAIEEMEEYNEELEEDIEERNEELEEELEEIEEPEVEEPDIEEIN